MINFLFDIAGRLKSEFEKRRERRWLEKLQDMGMHIGKDVFMPMSTWIDASHCFLISIGDKCRFGPNCVILAHDATMNEFLDAGKIGRVIIHESCSFGFGTAIMPGVEIGPRVITGAYSVIRSNIPPDSIVIGNPAQVVGKFDDFLKYHRMSMKRLPLFPYGEYGHHLLSATKQQELIKKLDKHGAGYIIGGYSAMLEANEFYSGRDK